MAYSSAKKERDKLLEHLDDTEHRLMEGKFNQSDFLTLIKINRELVYRAFEHEIDQDEADALHDQIMNEMDPWDFQD